ncbi:hypothetical protein CapIbe_008642 [Capra ibex]
MEPRTHPAPGSPASHPPFFAAPLSFKCVKLKWKADRCFAYFGGQLPPLHIEEREQRTRFADPEKQDRPPGADEP